MSASTSPNPQPYAKPPNKRLFHDMNDETFKHIGDAVSFSVVLGTLAAWLPAIAALFSIVWTGVRIYETNTVQRWLKK